MHPVEGGLGGERDAEACQQGPDEPDREGHAAPLERAGADLFADDRDLLERGIDDRLLRIRVAVEDEPQHRNQDEDQREEGEEAVVGDQR